MRPLFLLMLTLAIVGGSFAREDVALAQGRSGQGGRRGRQASVEGRNEFILRAPASRVAAIAARYGLTVIRPVDEHRRDVFLVSGPSRFGTRWDRVRSDTPALQDLLGQVQDDDEVDQFELNAAVVTPELTSVGLNQSEAAILQALSDRTLVNYFGVPAWNGFVNQPATDAIHLSARRGSGSTGAGIVAIIDTGVDPHHPLLAGSLVPGYDFVHDIAGDASEWSDLNGSMVSILDGSMVSILDGSMVSILDGVSVVSLNGSTVAILDQQTANALDPSQLPAAFGHGTMVAGLVHLVAPAAKIMPLKAFNADGTSNVFDIVRAIEFAVDHGARVINMSFSAMAASPEIAHAINAATGQGVICVASAGNMGQETLVYPGALRNVLGVGSTTTTDPPTRSEFSNYGDDLVSLGAPGEGVITTFPGGGYAGVWGTSFSTPMAAGAAALLLQADPTLDQAKVDSLLGNADKMAPGMGKGRLNLDAAARSSEDTTPPTITMLTPQAGGGLFGDVTVSASASDGVGVAGVRFLLDGSPLGAEDTESPYEVTWSTATAPNGSHLLSAVARDFSGNEASTSITVTVSNDTAPPTVALVSPAAGATLGGTVTVSASAFDDLEVFGVQFSLDGAPLGAEVTVQPYEVTWTTNTAANGTHTLTAVARDAAGHEATASADVMVANNLVTSGDATDTTPPLVALMSPTSHATVSGVVGLLAAASDDVGVVGVQFNVDGVPLGTEVAAEPYLVTWNTSSMPNGAHTVTVLARDAAGHETTSSVELTVANDTAAPTVALTSPGQGATVSQTVTVAADASDDVQILSVEFLLDGALLGSANSAAPYELSWDTTTATNGTHTLTAIAHDSAGHETTTSVAVTVANDTFTPVGAMTNPEPGAGDAWE